MSQERQGNLVEKLKTKLSYWYTQYELTLCINMAEPWERKLLNTSVVGIFLMVAYSSYVYLPNYLMSLVKKSILLINPDSKYE